MTLDFTNITYPDFVGLLTEEERNIVQSTWAKFKAHLVQNSIDLFIRYFRENPTYQKYFKNMSKLSLLEMTSSKRLKAHSVQVCTTLSIIVENLDDPETATELLFKVAVTHFPRNITEEMYTNLGKSVIGSLVEKLGSNVMNATAIDAWSKFYTALMEVFSEIHTGLEQQKKQQGTK